MRIEFGKLTTLLLCGQTKRLRQMTLAKATTREGAHHFVVIQSETGFLRIEQAVQLGTHAGYLTIALLAHLAQLLCLLTRKYDGIGQALAAQVSAPRVVRVIHPNATALSIGVEGNHLNAHQGK